MGEILTDIIFVRHAQSVYGDDDRNRPLTAEGLLDRLDPEDDFTSAKEIYQAYENVTPLLASLPDLWVYLAHVDLFPYVQKRHSDVFNDGVTEDYIIDHWYGIAKCLVECIPVNRQIT